jgi:hypothetical protein
MPELLHSPLSPFQLLIPISNRQTPNPISKDWPVELRCNDKTDETGYPSIQTPHFGFEWP